MPFRGDNPLNDIERLLDRMRREFEDVGFELESAGQTDPPIDLADRDDSFVMTVDLPGFETDDIDVSLVDGSVRIQADREETAEEGDETYLRRERHRRSVSRTVRLPEPVDEEGVTASFTNGVLTVTLPKCEPNGGGRRIEIE